MIRAMIQERVEQHRNERRKGIAERRGMMGVTILNMMVNTGLPEEEI